MPLIFYSLLPLVQEFLPHMLERGDGAILTAQGASTVVGLPNLGGPGPAQAAQRNYLQSRHAEVADRGVYVGMLYVGAVIENSASTRKSNRLRQPVPVASGGPRSTPGTSLNFSGTCTRPRPTLRQSIHPNEGRSPVLTVLPPTSAAGG